MKLDVGCGDFLRGDVNVDITKPTVRDKDFVQADGQYLPFRLDSFSHSACFHLIEHVEKPHLLLTELIRVTKETIEIRCPHRFSLIAKSKQHKHYFNKTWFNDILSQKPNLRSKIHITLDSERDIWRIPLELRVKIWKSAHSHINIGKKPKI